MKRTLVNPVLVLIVILLTAVIFFSPRISQPASASSELEQRVLSLEKKVQALEKYNKDRVEEEIKKEKANKIWGPADKN
jgi:cell division protein FtsL